MAAQALAAAPGLGTGPGPSASRARNGIPLLGWPFSPMSTHILPFRDLTIVQTCQNKHRLQDITAEAEGKGNGKPGCVDAFSTHAVCPGEITTKRRSTPSSIQWALDLRVVRISQPHQRMERVAH
jgi:hypothetical protein